MTATMTFTPVALPPVDYGTLDWQKVKLGGLGYVRGMGIAPDGSWMLEAIDVGGFYRRASGDTTSTQVVGSAGFPSTWSDPQTYNDSNYVGCWEFALSGNSTAYATFKAKVFKTTNKGVNWSITNFAVIPVEVPPTGKDMPPNTQPYERLTVNKMMADPDDANTVLIYTPKAGVYRTVDGGATWTQPTGLPNLSGQATGYRIGLFVCDRGSTVGSGRVWFAFAYGFGLYRSTDNGATWALASATYTQATDIQYMSSGVLWLADFAGTDDNVRVWTQGSGWTTITSTPASFKARYISVHPTNANEITLSGGGSSDGFVRSQDGGATWSGEWGAATLRSQHVETRAMSYSQDQDGAGTFAWSAGKPVYHPTDGYLYWPTGYGTCRTLVGDSSFTAPSSSNKLVFYDFAAGQEALAAIFGRILPDGTVLTCQQDRRIFRVADPTVYGLPNFVTGSWASSPSNCFYVDYVEGTPAKIGYACGSNSSGYSDNGGVSGVAFAVQPQDPLGVKARGGGSILRFDDQKFLRFQGENGRPIYSQNKGASWTVPTFTGATLPADGTANGFGHGLIDFNQRCVVKSRSTPGTVFAVNYGEGGSNTMRGCWKSTDYGVTWAKQSSSTIFIVGHMTLERADGVMYYTIGSTGSAYVQETTTARFYRSTDDGVNWEAIYTPTYTQAITEVLQVGIGAPSTVGGNKTVWIIGWVDHVLGVWYSTDKGLTWTKDSDLPGFDSPQYISADPTTFGRIMIGGSGTGHWIKT